MIADLGYLADFLNLIIFKINYGNNVVLTVSTI